MPTGALVPATLTVRFMEQCVTDDLEILIAEMARHQVHRYQCSLAAARQIRGKEST